MNAITKPVSKLFTVALLALPTLACAETYCVSTAAQLAAAIESADASSSASEIRVRTGFYSIAAAPPQQGQAVHALHINGTSDLLLTGGWSGANCETRSTLNPEQTVLSAGGNGKLMRIEFPSFPTLSTHTVEVSGISFRSATSNDLDGACVLVDSNLTSGSDRATLILDRNSFRLCNNTLDSSAPSALEVDVSNLNVYVRNNLFVDNAGYFQVVRLVGRLNTTHYVSNNTVAHNNGIGGNAIDGLAVLGANNSSFFWVVNNIAWANGSANANSDDLFTGGDTVGVVSSNLYGRLGSLSAGVSYISNLSTDPRFISANDVRLRADSPARNSGSGAAGGSLDSDLFGTPRVQGGRIDRGAHEYDELFGNGFE